LHCKRIASIVYIFYVLFLALKTEHERQLNEITEKFESIKHSLLVSANRQKVNFRLWFMYMYFC